MRSSAGSGFYMFTSSLTHALSARHYVSCLGVRRNLPSLQWGSGNGTLAAYRPGYQRRLR